MLKRSLSPGYEQPFWTRGLLVAGLDEAGRGAWAGPIVAGAVIFPAGIRIHGIHDSKKLSPEARRDRFVAITKTALSWSVGLVDVGFIERWGIQAANRLALLTALRRLSIKPDHVVIDAFRLPLGKTSQEAFPRADGQVFSVAAASIIAKVIRDHLMGRFDAETPGYNFTQHKGYGTEAHRSAIERLGLSPLHRQSFYHERPNLGSRRLAKGNMV